MGWNCGKMLISTGLKNEPIFSSPRPQTPEENIKTLVLPFKRLKWFFKWRILQLKFLTFFSLWKAPSSNPGWDQHFWSFLVKISAAFSSNLSIRNSYYFCKRIINPIGNVSETFWIQKKDIEFPLSLREKNFNFNFWKK